MITVRTEKVCVDGKRYRKIAKLKARGIEGLPAAYILGHPMIYLKDGKLVIHPHNGWFAVWAVGNLIEEHRFQRHMGVIRAAGSRLCLTKQPKNTTPWKGSEAFHI